MYGISKGSVLLQSVASCARTFGEITLTNWMLILCVRRRENANMAITAHQKRSGHLLPSFDVLMRPASQQYSGRIRSRLVDAVGHGLLLILALWVEQRVLCCCSFQCSRQRQLKAKMSVALGIELTKSMRAVADARTPRCAALPYSFRLFTCVFKKIYSTCNYKMNNLINILWYAIISFHFIYITT